MAFHESQLQAIHHQEGPMMVLAGPGSGKTTVITHRVKYLVEQCGVEPGSILVITFTKAAAQEMRQRFEKLTEGRRLPVSFGTFHAVFFAILKRAYRYDASNIAQDEQRTRIIRELVDKLQMDVEDEAEFTSQILSEISLVKGEMMNLDYYYSKNCSEELFKKLYQGYEKAMVDKGLLDFDDMLVLCYELFTQRKDILAAWQNKYQYILIDEFQEQNINICLPSLRIDAFSLDVMSKVQDVKKSSLTFAPEAGSQRMRNVINKGLTEDVILNGANQAFHGGWNKVKLYFMLGLPNETEEDMKEIARLADRVARRYYEIPKDQRNGKCQITASSSFFIPKPFTPFQWARMYTNEEYISRAATVKHAFNDQLNRKSLKYHWHDAEVTVLEGVFARGDRKVSKVIEEAYHMGCIYDAWSENFDNDKWMEAFRRCGLTIAFYNERERGEEELFPWDFIDIGVTKKFLRREWERAMNAEVTPNCRQKCSGCGAGKYQGGVCVESKN